MASTITATMIMAMGITMIMATVTAMTITTARSPKNCA
jgi:hypothetical protein